MVNDNISQVVPTSFGVGAVVGLLWLWPVGPIVKKKMEANRAARQGTEQTTNAAGSAAAVHPTVSMHSIGSSLGSSMSSHKERRGSHLLCEYIHPAASVRSIGSSIGSHKERRGSHLAEYDPEEGAIKFAVSESVKSLKLTIDSEAASESSENEDEITEHATNIDASHRAKKKTKKKKNFLIRFEEATYKQNLEEQCFRESRTTEECWQNAAKYDSDVEQLFTYVQVFTASLSSFAHGANDIGKKAVHPFPLTLFCGYTACIVHSFTIHIHAAFLYPTTTTTTMHTCSKCNRTTGSNH